MTKHTAFNDPAALRQSTHSRNELIYGQIKQFSVEKRLLTLETLNGKQLTLLILPQVWCHLLNNLGKEAQGISELSSSLVPGRWVMARCLIYSEENSILLETHELILTCIDAGERLAHEQDWWRDQIQELADFYLIHLFGCKREPKINFAEYRTYLKRDGQAQADNRQETAVLSRLVYGFATAFMMTGEKIYLDAAQEGSDYLIAHFCMHEPEEGGTYWFHGIELNTDGTHTIILASEAGDDLSALACYEQIYALAGLAQTYRACCNPRYLEVCLSSITFIRRHFRDKESTGGYFSHIDPLFFNPLEDDLECNRGRKNWNSIGDHIPAYLIQLYLGTQDPELHAFLIELQNLLLTHFQSKDGSPFIEERFHSDWEEDHGWGWQQNRAVIGHNLKIIWNLLRLQNLNPDPRALPFCQKLIQPVIYHGFDALRSGWFDMVERQSPHHLCWHDRKAWWQQEQAILALQLLQSQDPGEDKWGILADASSDFYNSFFLDHQHGGVLFSVTAGGTPWLAGQEGLKGSHCMGGYHAFELCLYATTYGNLLLRNKQLTLTFRVIPDQIPEHRLHVAPDLLPTQSAQIHRVLLNGEPWNCNQEILAVDLPSGSDPVTVEVTLEARVIGFQLERLKNGGDNKTSGEYLMRGYLCEYFLPILRHQLKELSSERELVLDASQLEGACPAGIRYLVLLKQEQRNQRTIRIINIPAELHGLLAQHSLT
ncbi:AGE family epimerase/isomerase [Cyanobium sp. HWJ4-Hawea]|uniref:AGE family epimerase/isomerase n=1 Tax=Cyanobium sp. HWJ4-Hawea TaxID=2823713 RepID=UPI0020CEDD4C|nr:AGE family epimerase/isomerase [Cyanobium sp. HWJ4-Hawea]MCP9810131.1 AGE family epimerase/isomerase [Cyanobium sp. HWJ4-Hawea]